MDSPQSSWTASAAARTRRRRGPGATDHPPEDPRVHTRQSNGARALARRRDRRDGNGARRGAPDAQQHDGDRCRGARRQPLRRRQAVREPHVGSDG